MNWPRRLAVAGVLALTLLLWPTSSEAAPFTPQLEADYTYAEQWWGGAQPVGCSSVTREVVPGASIEASGRATRPLPGAAPVPCVMYIAEELVPCARQEVVLHEYGHLLGFEHSSDPHDIMYAGGIPGTECKRHALQLMRRGIKENAARCHARPHPAPAQRAWCREQITGWREMIIETEAELRNY